VIRVRTRALALSLLLPVSVLGACNNSQASSAEAPQPAQLAQNTGTASSKRAPAPAQTLSESDRILLDMASNACKASDYRTFFDSFVKSKAVRLKYSAATVQYTVLGSQGAVISKQSFDGAGYPNFPVRMEDYSYRPVKPVRAGDTNEYLDLQFNQSQNNDISIEWSRIHYVGPPTAEEDLGTPTDANGKPIPNGTHPDAEGQLLFRPTADCWEFSEDIRWDREK
jgi:hypothetical protein